MIIKSRCGKDILIDSWNYDWASQFTWHVNNHGYPISQFMKNGRYTRILLHKLVARDVENNSDIDHINRNKLDAREINLRKATRSQNIANSAGQKRRRSKYKGVSYCKRDGLYKAQVCCNYKRYFLGRFDTEEQAALAYNKKSLELFGEFSYQNNIEQEVKT